MIKANQLLIINRSGYTLNAGKRPCTGCNKCGKFGGKPTIHEEIEPLLPAGMVYNQSHISIADLQQLQDNTDEIEPLLPNLYLYDKS
jgi:hypothetical protein